ncbi:MAG: YjbQ family protein [Deferribacteres bacterium]|nr:secondary thiamine-phosphate synthase enzyme YjbQ [candidate division KSB1 bacterium]MCB9502107.1 YjbQ family protein [Deferribacteres bacterium]
MAWFQKEITLQARPRGFHLITREIEEHLPELKNFHIGNAHIFILHTSASLTLNENADPDVRSDMEAHFNKFVPERAAYYRHTFEGADDMPAHIKASILGSSVLLPIKNGHFYTGTWQGVYLGEHRNHGGRRRIVVTLHGEAD